jgi:hypothetical protein
LSFFDEDDEPRRTPRPRRGRPSGGGVATADTQTLLIRRAVALVGGIIVLLALFFLVNSCRNSARENALKDYNRQLSTIATDSARQVGAPFFQLLSESGASAPQPSSPSSGGATGSTGSPSRSARRSAMRASRPTRRSTTSRARWPSSWPPTSPGTRA